MENKDNSDLKKVFSEHLNTALMKKGYKTDSAFLKAIDGKIAQSRFSNLKNTSSSTLPSAEELIVLSDSLEVSIDYLLGRDVEQVNNREIDIASLCEIDVFKIILELEKNGFLWMRNHITNINGNYTDNDSDSLDLCLNHSKLNTYLLDWYHVNELYGHDDKKKLLPDNVIDLVKKGLIAKFKTEHISAKGNDGSFIWMDDIPFPIRKDEYFPSY